MSFIQVRDLSGVAYLQSPVLRDLGIPHGFSTRRGGVSKAPFSSLNLGNPTGEIRDRAENLSENLHRFLTAMEVSNRPLRTVRQMHGCEVAHFGGNAPPYTPASQDKSEPCSADAIILSATDALAGIRTADCVPILIAGMDGQVVAAIHAGWRGLVGGVIGRTIENLERMGVTGDKLVAAVGPCIGVEHFEIGPEVVPAFERAGLSAALVRGPRMHANLPLAAKIELVHFGVRRVDMADQCTYQDADLFFSHRRDRGQTGRMLAVIGCRN